MQIAAGMRDRGWTSRSVVLGPGWVLNGLQERALHYDIVETQGRFDVRYLWQLRSLVRRHGVELIHAHLFSPAVYASLVAALEHVPLVATFHGASDVEYGGWSTRLRYRFISRRATIVCVSESLAAAIPAQGLSTATRSRVIHNGVDVARFAAASGHDLRLEHGVADDTFLIGALGNMRDAKDYPTLLRAAAVLAPDLRVAVAIVGEPAEPLLGELTRLRSELGLEQRVSFWGFRNDVPEVLAAFDALAISSVSEGFSLAAVQALAAGKPVVATRCGGPEEILTDGVDGLLVPTSSPDALAGALHRLIESPNLCTRLSTAGRMTAAGRFSVESMLDAYETLYLECMGRTSA